MIDRILLPLDGSELAKCILPYATELAKALGAQIFLLGVASPPAGQRAGMFRPATPTVGDLRIPESAEDVERSQHTITQDAEMASIQGEWKSELVPMATQLRKEGIQVSVQVAFGRPASTIMSFAERNNIDLILLSTHGVGGVRPYAFGGTADRIARRSEVPVLFVRPESISKILPHPKPVTED